MPNVTAMYLFCDMAQLSINCAASVHVCSDDSMVITADLCPVDGSVDYKVHLFSPTHLDSCVCWFML